MQPIWEMHKKKCHEDEKCTLHNSNLILLLVYELAAY